MKIYDGFSFNDELDLLELRLMETADLIDRFVLVEFPFNFHCKPKPLHYLENKSRFEQWNHQIEHVIATDIPLEPLVVDHCQRRMIAKGFSGLEFSDTIIVGDADEIPSREALQLIKKKPPCRPYVLEQYLYYYRVNNLAGKWRGTMVLPRGLGKLDCQAIRHMRTASPVLPVKTGGWHFSWLGDAEDVKNKLRSLDVKADNAFYKSQLPVIPHPDEDAEFVEHVVSTGSDLFGRSLDYKMTEISPGVLQPTCIDAWLRTREKYVA